MFKRMNKITALIVAVAGVVSLLPSTGVSASTRLGTKDGNIDNAIAFKDGKYIFEGYKTDDDDKSIYYNANSGSKDKQLKDLDESTLISTFSDKYAYVEDGSDQYLVDLSNGKVIDDEGPEDSADNAKTKLRSALKKTDRYGKDGLNVILDQDSEIKTANKFLDTWYSYKAEVKEGEADGYEDAITDEKTGTKVLYGFTNKSGKYIDASKLANIYAYSTERNKTVKIEEFNHEDRDAKLNVTLKEQPKVIAQDKNYIYALTNVMIEDTSDKLEATKATIKFDFDNITTTAGAHIELPALPGKQDKGIFSTDFSKVEEKDVPTEMKRLKYKVNAYCLQLKLPDYEYNDETYSFVAKEPGVKNTKPSDFGKNGIKFIDGGGKGTAKYTDAKYIQKISKAQGNREDDAYLPKTVASYEVSKNYDCGDADDAEEAIEKAENYSVKGGKLYAISLDGDNVKVTVINLKKDKVELDNSKITDRKVDVYLAEKDTDDDNDAEVADNEGKGYSIDVDGNVWVVNKGKILKFSGKEFKEVYTCDRSLDSLDVYDDGSLVAWEHGEDVYTTVQEGKKEVEDETTPAHTGWVNTAAGWTFYDGSGKQVLGAWANAGGIWYLMKPDGIMATGWQNNNGNWYFLDTTSGAMKTGWYNDNGTWYYLQASGAMKTGWINLNGIWYFLNTTSGAMKTGWLNDNGTWYYLSPSGAMKTGWLNDNGTWYYINSSGAMLANTTIDGYKLGANGAWVR